MSAFSACLALVVGTLALVHTVHAASLVTADYEAPVNRYGHFAAGVPHEYGRLSVTLSDGGHISLTLDDDQVFEDVAPRVVRLAPQAPAQILTIVSHRERGARLVVFGLAGTGLQTVAESSAIGTPMRWLNPVDVADLDGDGQAEVVAVVTPHIAGELRVYRRQGRTLTVVATLGGVSNHVYGSPELRLGAVASLAGRTGVLVPDTARKTLRWIGLEHGQLVEWGRCELPAPLIGPLTLVPPSGIHARLSTGPWSAELSRCLGLSR